DLTSGWGKAKRPFKRTKVRPVYLDDAQVDALAATAERLYDANLALMIRLTARCGFRVSEVCALPREAVYERGRLCVHQALGKDSYLSSAWETTTLKSEAAYRHVPVPEALWEALDDSVAPEADAALFRAQGHSHWGLRSLGDRWAKIVKAPPSVPSRTRFHALRHTAARRMLTGNGGLCKPVP